MAECYTNLGRDYGELNWTLDHVNEFFSCADNKYVIKSNIFNTSGNLSWQCSLKASDMTWVSIILTNTSGLSNLGVRVWFKYIMINSLGHEIEATDEKTQHLGSSEQSFAIKLFRRGIQLLNDTVTIICRLYVLKPPITINGCSPITIPKSGMLADITKMYESRETDGDVTIIVDGKKFKASKFILMARSNYFAAMFRDFKEKNQHPVELRDISHIIFDELLRFIYTNKVKNLNDNAVELLKAAELYRFDRLKALCSAVLLKRINVDNAKEMLDLATNHNAPDLKINVHAFIRRNLMDIPALNTSEQ